MSIERILITVRTYPNVSTKYVETVCTAGINDAGQWRRLYPVRLRHLDNSQQYRTFDVVRVKLGLNPDGRPESRRPDIPSLRVHERVKDWDARRAWVLPTAVASMRELRATTRTLAPVVVQEVLKFEAKPAPAEWTEKQKQVLAQDGLFEGPEPLEKIPFDFRLTWRDGDGEEHDHKYIAWEVGETWRKWRHQYDDPVDAIRQKWLGDLFGPTRDVWFFMGNFAEHRQHFGVCGTFTPPKEKCPSDRLW